MVLGGFRSFHVLVTTSSDDDDNDNKLCTQSWLYNCSMFNSQQCGYRITVITELY